MIVTEGSSTQERFAARLAAVQALYEKSQNNREINDLIDDFIRKRQTVQVDDSAPLSFDFILFKAILCGMNERFEDLSGILEAHLEGKDIEPLMKSIVLSGGYELLAHQDIDFPIIINDYLNITHSFFDQSEVNLINGILDKMAKSLRE